MKYTTEDDIEIYNLELLEKLGYNYICGYDIQPEGKAQERETFSEVVLRERLQTAVSIINPHIPYPAQQQAIREVLDIASPDLITNNQKFHEYLTAGITIESQENNETIGKKVWLIDWQNPQNNEFLAINQFTVIEDNHNRRPDIILFVNGLPLVAIELKNAADKKADIYAAYNQLQTYKREIPSLFTYNALLVISDGLTAKAGSLSAGYTRFMTWKTPTHKEGNKNLKVPRSEGEGFRERVELEVLTEGMLNKATLLDLIRHFTVFEETKTQDPETEIVTIQKTKKIAAYHQYYAVNKAVESIVRATGKPSPNPSLWEGNKKIAYRGGLARTTLLEQVRELRKNQTSAEKVFWEIVRAKRFFGLKFRRQHQIGNYIVDFYCHAEKLVIELDGGIHDEPVQKERDRQRDEYLKSLGHQILRFRNAQIFNDLEKVLDSITNFLSPDLPSPNPSHKEGNRTQNEGEGFRERGDRRGGVIWHTQGSGKSLSMVFLSGKLVLHPELQNPTILVLTDRNDLDDQLFDTFAGCRQLLRQEPQQADNRNAVQDLLKVASGGVVFSTIQKFAPTDGDFPTSGGNQKGGYPTLSNRENIVVLADEAHRSQYGFKARQVDLKDESGQVIGKQTKYGFARYIRDALPKATFVGFTGTPIESTDKNTKEIFGSYIDIYDIAQAVRDGATVPIYYESRLVKLELEEQGRQLIEELDEDLQFEELSTVQKAKTKGTQLEALVGSSKRVEAIAQDIVSHFAERQKANRGKAMIVTMSRRIAANLYAEIIKLNPDWHDQDLSKGKIKVVMTASAADEGNLVQHHTSKGDRQKLAQRLKDSEDELEMVIVCDMWLTGFDAPCLHTMYIDKPLKAHNLMQAIARINRVYFDKEGGLVVDYLGLASELKKALSFYAESGGKGEPTLDQEVALGLVLTKIEVIEQILEDFNSDRYFNANTGEKLNLLMQATDYVCHPDRKERFLKEVTALSKAYSLAVPHPEALTQAEKISFFQAIQASIYKLEPSHGESSTREIESAIRQVVDQALVTDAVINIFDEAGIKNPDISIIADEFIDEVRGMEHKNLAVELLQKLLNDEVRNRGRVNLVQSRKLADMLEDSLRRYHNHVISVTDVIEELLNLSQEVTQGDRQAKELGLEPYEYAFYLALADNQSAVDVMGIEELRKLAIALTERIKKNASIDWNLKESVRARMKIMVKRLLRQYGYPPDMAALAIELVLEQAKVYAEVEVKNK